MAAKNKKIIAFMNAFSQGKSGADIALIEILKREKNHPKIIITSLLGKELCQENGLEAEYLLTTKEKKFNNPWIIYLKRIFLAIFLKINLDSRDLLIVSSDALPDVIPAFFMKLRKRKTLWFQRLHHLIPKARKIAWLFQKLSFILIKSKADQISVNSKLLKSQLISLGFSLKKIFVNYSGIGIKDPEKIKTKKHGYEAVFMAQLRRSKGILDLPEIWQEVIKIIPQARLAIIGKGEEKIIAGLRGKIVVKQVNKNIDLLGFLPNQLAFETIKSAKVFIFPSYEEGFGLVLVEAQALGLPVVAWDLPVFAEIFPQGMIKISQGDKVAFARAVIEILENNELRQKLTKEALVNARRFNWEKTAEREIAVIKTMFNE